MSRLLRLVGGFCLVLALLLPALAAQEEKKEAPKAGEAEKKDGDKKEPDKGEPAKKDETEPKKEDTSKKGKEKEPEEKPLPHSTIARVKVKNSDGDFTVEVPIVDPQKYATVQQWAAQQQQSIARQTNPIQRQQQLARFQADMAKKMATEIHSPKDQTIKLVEGFKVRSMFLPSVYDDRGNVKTYTKKDLEDLKGNTKMPGYKAELADVRPGMTVDVYLAKAAPAPKGPTLPKGKKLDDDPETPMPVPEAVMVVIVGQAPAAGK